MTLPLKTSYRPMEAKSITQLPSGENWQYEPKWDGFRCLAFRDGAEIALQSKSGQPLARYFPELVEALLKLKPTQFVIDGEIVVPIKGKFSFDDLLTAGLIGRPVAPNLRPHTAWGLRPSPPATLLRRP